MRTALRKMGNSTGMIVPKVILKELKVDAGTTLDIKVEDGGIVATPVPVDPRVLWAAELKALDEAGELELTQEDYDWMAFGTEFDAEWEW